MENKGLLFYLFLFTQKDKKWVFQGKRKECGGKDKKVKLRKIEYSWIEITYVFQFSSMVQLRQIVAMSL